MCFGSKTGKTTDGTQVSGTITIPEAAHDTQENEYVVRTCASPEYEGANQLTCSKVRNKCLFG